MSTMEFYEGYESSTHQPLLKAVIKAYKPDFILELGVGDFSTPILSGVKNYLGIENNKDWIDRIKKDYDINIYYHKVDFGIATRLEEIGDKTKNSLVEFYNKIIVPKYGTKLLFVDNWTACRTIAINTLCDKFDLIIFHDCQPEGILMYSYNEIESPDFEMMFLKSPTSWTALMYRIKKELNIQPFIDEYLQQWPDAFPMKLTEIYA